MKRRIVRLLQRYLLNPPVKAALALGVVPPTHALLETVGRKTGKPRRNPVGNGLADDKTTFWIVAEHGPAARSLGKDVPCVWAPSRISVPSIVHRVAYRPTR